MNGKLGHIVFWSLSIVLLALTAVLHVSRIGEHPAGMHVDEGSIAFNALCIAETGMDEHMIGHPVFFKSFGDYKNPLMIYVLAPVVKIFGMTKESIRITSSVFHILASVAMFFLALKYCRNRYISLVAAFVFSALPWLFPVSRIMICGFMPMLLFLITGWLLLFRAFRTRSYMLAISAGLLFALAMYSTHSGRPITAVILLCAAASLWRTAIRRWGLSLAFCATLGVLMTPVAYCMLTNPISLTSRFSEIAVWKDSSGIGETLGRIALRYSEYFRPEFLFISGDSFIAHCTRQSGSLYLFMIPFIIAGIAVAIKYFKWNPYYRFLLLGLIFYPVAASLTIGRGHSTCCMNGAVFFMVTAVVGARFFWISRKKYSVVLIIAGIMALYELPAYFYDYFTRYRTASRSVFSAPQYEAVQEAWKMLEGRGTLYVSAYIYFPEEVQDGFKKDFYTNILFITGITPREFFEKGIDRDRICVYNGKISGPGLLLRLDKIIVEDASGNPVVRSDYEPIPQGARLLRKIPTPSGINFEIYAVK